MKKFLHAVAATALCFSVPAMADDGMLGDCIKAARAKQEGDFVKVEYLSKSAKGVPTFELELRDGNGVEYEFMCDATSGQLYEAETEVDKPSDSKFAPKVSEEEAMAIATNAYPGEVVEVEYEIESDGGSTYEFDIIGKDGKETKVEVDAASGKIIEVHAEDWEIGEEPEEKRKK